MMYYERKKNNYLGTILIIFFLMIIILVLVNLINKIDSNYYMQAESEETGTETVLSEFNIENLMKNSIYSVVGISKLNETSTSIFVENSEEKLGIGSGIIVTSNGYILTNQSIVGEKGSNCYVKLKNGETYVADVVWIDKNVDIALIKIAAQNLISLSMGDSDSINLGQEIYMISNPSGFGINQKIQTGIISEKYKTFKIVNETGTQYIEDIIKVNSKIENSQTGSPILNVNGELLGISSSKLDIVIPINRIKNLIQNFEKNDNYEEPYIGVYGYDNDVIGYLNLGISNQKGIYIEKINEDSPAYEKILTGDIITNIDDLNIERMQDLISYIYTKKSRRYCEFKNIKKY